MTADNNNEGAATTVVLRQTVNLFRKVNIVGSTPTPSPDSRKIGRVVECSALLKRRTVKRSIGSNPISSAK